MEFGLFNDLEDQDAAAALCDQLHDFSRRYPDPGIDPESYVAMFRGDVANDDDFLRRLWGHLQAMSDIDARTHAWDSSVNADPDSLDFSFSVASRAFFVVGLNPHSERRARRAPFPCLVFNFHHQSGASELPRSRHPRQTALGRLRLGNPQRQSASMRCSKSGNSALARDRTSRADFLDPGECVIANAAN